MLLWSLDVLQEDLTGPSSATAAINQDIFNGSAQGDVEGMFVCGRPWACSQGLPVGKQERGVPSRPRMPHAQVSPSSVSNVVVAAVRPSAAVLKGRLGDTEVDILLDSGSTVSLVQNSILP